MSVSARDGSTSLHSQVEHLQMKYVGTGHADTNKFEWAVNIHRDTYASYIGHHGLIQYFATGLNESIGRLKYHFTNKMLAPCGPPPVQEEDADEKEDEETK